MLFKFFRDEESQRLDQIETKTKKMLEYDRSEFDLAMAALFGDVPAEKARADLRKSDRKVNELEREIRRELLVHASVLGGIDSPAVLVYMSVVKDIERVGDYAKNLVDLARDGANLEKAPNTEHWRKLSAEVSRYIAEVGEAFHKRDSKRAHTLVQQGDRLLSHFDARVTALIQEDPASPQAVPRALAHRYLKRVVAHLMNLLSSVIMPIDRLDYFDEDPEDRGGA